MNMLLFSNKTLIFFKLPFNLHDVLFHHQQSTQIKERVNDMKNLEKVEKLRKKANISYEEAKAVLEECEWDLLDAIVKLESEGKINSDTAEFSTEGNAAEDEIKSPMQIAESYQNYQQKQQKNNRGFFSTLKAGIKYLIRKSCDNKFEVSRHGKTVISVPVLVLIILLLASFWTLLIIMLIGLFFGFVYSFAGPDLGRDDINNEMRKATEAAENLKAEIKASENSPTDESSSNKENC